MGEEYFWKFDQYDFKEATSLLLLNDPNDDEKTEIELKKLITDQFKQNSDLSSWIINNFNKVNYLTDLPNFYCSI